MIRFSAFAVAFLLSISAPGQDITVLFAKAKTKIDRVNSYTAKGRMKTNVTFLKVPIANVTISFKKPDQLRVVSEKGVSFIPKGAVNINLVNLGSGNRFTIIDAGRDPATGLRIARLLPDDQESEIVLSTAYIEESTALIKKVRTTTRDNGSYELELSYGKYADYALPDKVVFSFNTKDYKLPKGVTFDFDDGSSNKTPSPKNRKGKAEIVFSSYVINKP